MSIKYRSAGTTMSIDLKKKWDEKCKLSEEQKELTIKKGEQLAKKIAEYINGLLDDDAINIKAEGLSRGDICENAVVFLAAYHIKSAVPAYNISEDEARVIFMHNLTELLKNLESVH